jgi:hypothetical protein
MVDRRAFVWMEAGRVSRPRELALTVFECKLLTSRGYTAVRRSTVEKKWQRPRYRSELQLERELDRALKWS